MTAPDPMTVREVTQWFLAGREDGIPGDCVRASVASLLDLDPHDVPHFTCQDDTRVWPLAIAGFAAEHGWRISRRAYDGGELPKFGLAIGPSPRGVSHMVVIRDGEMAWDPHPSREGLVDVQQVIEFTRAVSWPDEQQPAKATGGEQVQDGALVVVQRFADAWREDDQWRRTHSANPDTWFQVAGTDATLTEPQLRAVLAERDALAARVAELEGERKADTRVVVTLLRFGYVPSEGNWMTDAEAVGVLRARFADRIAALGATETEKS